MAGPPLSPSASPSRSSERTPDHQGGHTSRGQVPPHPTSLKHNVLTVKTPLLPHRSGINMDSAQNYGADAEKRALAKASELEKHEWSRETYEHAIYRDTPRPSRRYLTWAAALFVCGLIGYTIFQNERAYQTAKDIVEDMTPKQDKPVDLYGSEIEDMLSARQSSDASNSTGNSTGKYGTLAPLALKPLPLGSIKAQGWLATEMQSHADGLAGHEMDFYPIVSESLWLGGSTDYSPLNEGLPYWLNGIVPLAYGLDDDRLKGQVKTALSYIFDHQNSTNGFLGPVGYGDSRDLWSRYPFFLGLANVAAADSSMTTTVLDAMYKFLPHANDLLGDGQLTAHNEDWARSRYPDMILTLQWLFENHPVYNGTDYRGLLWSMMNNLKHTGIDWAGYYTEQSYFFQDLDTVPAFTGDGSGYFPFLHGVNVGQGLKAMAVNYRFTNNQSLLDTQKNAVDWTMKYHGAASGTILADERESSLAPNRGSELCTAVETIFSMHTIYSITGQNEYADHAELAAFNALPVMLTADHWAHQYIALPNQPWAAPLAGHDIFWNVGDFGTTFGMSPNYPCCTVNHPQGYPKFTAATYMTKGNDGLAHVLLAPAKATTKLGNGASVTVNAVTDYPFSDILTYQINTDKPFTFYVRVPGWASSPSLTLNGNQMAVSADSGSGLAPINIGSGQSTVQFVLQSSLRAVERANDTIAVYRGALLYAVDVGQTNTSVPGTADITRNMPPTSDQDVIQALSYYPNETYQPASLPSQARDYNISNTMPWNWAIDESTLQFYSYNSSSNKGEGVNKSSTVMLNGESASGDSQGNAPSLADPIWQYQGPTQYVTAKACPVKWDLLGGSPFRPPLKGDRQCQGDAVTVVMRPYGSLKLHMAELPTVSLGSGSNSTNSTSS